MQYLLPCECGQKHRLTASQAGQSLPCSCGASLHAPAFRDLKNLEVAPEESKKKRSAGGTWNPLQGAAFGLGAGLIGVSAVCLAMVSLYLGGLHPQEPVLNPEFLKHFLAEIDTNTPEKNLDVWHKEIIEEGLSRPGRPVYLVHQHLEQRLFLFRRIFYGVLVMGIVSLLASFVIKNPRGRKKPHQS